MTITGEHGEKFKIKSNGTDYEISAYHCQHSIQSVFIPKEKVIKELTKFLKGEKK